MEDKPGSHTQIILRCSSTVLFFISLKLSFEITSIEKKFFLIGTVQQILSWKFQSVMSPKMQILRDLAEISIFFVHIVKVFALFLLYTKVKQYRVLKNKYYNKLRRLV